MTSRKRQSRRALAARVLILIAALAIAAPRVGVSAGERFVPPSLTKATDIPYPVEEKTTGLVTLSANLTVTAEHLPTIRVLRDVPGLTGLASALVATWKYSPGMLDGKAAPSTINIEVLFNPPDVAQGRLDLPPVSPTPPPLPDGYLPAEVAAGSFASTPVTKADPGAVVLDVTIDKNGGVKKIDVIRDIPSLTQEAVSAVKRWTINPATFNGKPIESQLVVAFVFRPTHRRYIGVQ
jgi:hypothetical protein